MICLLMAPHPTLREDGGGEHSPCLQGTSIMSTNTPLARIWVCAYAHLHGKQRNLSFFSVAMYYILATYQGVYYYRKRGKLLLGDDTQT